MLKMRKNTVLSALLIFMIALAACTPASSTTATSAPTSGEGTTQTLVPNTGSQATSTTAATVEATVAATTSATELASPTMAATTAATVMATVQASPTTAATSDSTPLTESGTINFYTDSDTNISDWISNKIVPAFEQKFPQYKVKVTIVRGVGNGDDDIADRALAAMKTNSDPQVDIIEYDATSKPELIQAGLWLKVDSTNIPNSSNLLQGVKTSDFSMPYRGSQVLLAYDSDKVKESEVPHTFADLMTWVKAHPGQFVYCRPDKGGSGGNFVVRAIYETTGKDPSIFKPGDPDPKLVAEFPKAWTMLRDIHTSIYDNGAYPSGNTQVLTLLANGSVSMATVWSDQALQALAKGVLPPSVKLTQLTDLPFPGGSTMLSIPKNSRNVKGAQEFLNFLLSNDGQMSVVKEIGGFPAVEWKVLPADLQQQYNSVIANTVPNWPGGKWDAEMNKGWYDNVATNIKQGS
jgi:putative spermidine/putrescine transport system substrate-binding protein